MKNKHIEIIALAVKNNYDWNSIYQDLIAHYSLTKNDYAKANELISLCEKHNIKVSTILDSDYPSVFKNTTRPPFIIFYKGDITKLDKDYIDQNNVGIYASRNLTSQQENDLKHTVKDMLNHHKTIVFSYDKNSKSSKLIAKYAIAEQAPYIAYLNDTNDFKDQLLNESCDLIISEFPIGFTHTIATYPLKYRIMAMCANSHVLGYCQKKSAINMLVNWALNYGKNIYAIPYTFDENALNNNVIDQGGYAYVSPFSFVHY